MDTAFGVIWFFLPAGVANMAPIIFNRLPLLDIPIDFGYKFRGREIFGSHKTWRGLAVGIASAILIVYFQKLIYSHTASIALIDYSTINIFWLGFLLGFGALAGDLLKSFAKRRFDIPSGKSWVPFDQLDWIIGAMVATAWTVNLTVGQILIALAVFGLSHPLANLVGYGLKFKPNKF